MASGKENHQQSYGIWFDYKSLRHASNAPMLIHFLGYWKPEQVPEVLNPVWDALLYIFIESDIQMNGSK